MPLDSATAASAATFAEERFTDLREEADGLFRAHWEEASADRSVPLDLDWDVYADLERIGAMMAITVRVDGALVGYAIYVVMRHLHYRTRSVAHSDAFFLDKRFRQSRIGMRMFRFAEEVLRARGVDDVSARVKLHVKGGRRRASDLQPVFRRMGYRPVETLLTKRLR